MPKRSKNDIEYSNPNIVNDHFQRKSGCATYLLINLYHLLMAHGPCLASTPSKAGASPKGVKDIASFITTAFSKILNTRHWPPSESLSPNTRNTAFHRPRHFRSTFRNCESATRPPRTRRTHSRHHRSPPRSTLTPRAALARAASAVSAPGLTAAPARSAGGAAAPRAPAEPRRRPAPSARAAGRRSVGRPGWERGRRRRCRCTPRRLALPGKAAVVTRQAADAVLRGGCAGDLARTHPEPAPAAVAVGSGAGYLPRAAALRAAGAGRSVHYSYLSFD